jgi:hypothetical protein
MRFDARFYGVTVREKRTSFGDDLRGRGEQPRIEVEVPASLAEDENLVHVCDACFDQEELGLALLLRGRVERYFRGRDRLPDVHLNGRRSARWILVTRVGDIHFEVDRPCPRVRSG